MTNNIDVYITNVSLIIFSNLHNPVLVGESHCKWIVMQGMNYYVTYYRECVLVICSIPSFWHGIPLYNCAYTSD